MSFSNRSSKSSFGNSTPECQDSSVWGNRNPPQPQNALEKVVIMSDLTLEKHGLDAFNSKVIRKTAADKLCKDYTTGSESLKFWQHHKHITFGDCSNLNEITNGGLSIRGITEISGEAGSGKSQICMQLALTVQLPKILGGLGKKAAYISTQEGFPIRRIRTLQKSFIGIGGLSEEKMLESIFIQEIRDTQSLISAVARLPLLFAQHDIGLVVIDSVAAPLRMDTDYVDRANQMRIMVRNLLRLSRQHECAVVCVNQVTSNGDTVIPSLGLAWANLVNTRIKLSKTNGISIRNFEVISSEIAQARTKFAITPEGIKNAS